MQYQSQQKLSRSLNLARIEKCQKERWHYFSILRGLCFLTFFDTSKTERAKTFPSFSDKPHAIQDDMEAELKRSISDGIVSPGGSYAEFKYNSFNGPTFLVNCEDFLKISKRNMFDDDIGLKSTVLLEDSQESEL